jgi:hypothetical protein
MIRIKLECWWTNPNSLKDRFIKQFVPESDLKSYEFVDNNPDFTIVFGKTEFDKIETPKDRNFFFSQEPLWSPNEDRSRFDLFSKIIISDKTIFENKKEYVESLLPMFYAGHGEYHEDKNYDWGLFLKDSNFNKTKSTSVIVRKDYASYWDSLEIKDISKIIYRLRTDLSIKLSENENIDIFGTHWENNGKNIFGSAWNKRVALNDYRFSFCSENSIQKNYISEKFWDVVLTDTVPIYLGCSNIDEYIPSDYYINLNQYGNDIDVMNDLICDITKNSETLYKLYEPKIKELKKMFFNDERFNLWIKIKNLINDFN